MNDEFELEFSTYCQHLERDGRSVQVEIYRGKDRDEPWILEIVDDDTGSSILWDDQFKTDKDAFDFLLAEINKNGLDKVIDDAPEVPFPE